MRATKGALAVSECDRFCSRTGQKVRVYWAEDKQWYHGVIRDFKPSTNESLIVYDDGESEWLNLTSSGNETVEFLYDPNTKDTASSLNGSTHSNHSNGSSPSNGPNGSQYKKGRRTSGKVATTFDHGFVVNLSSGYTAIAFENEYVRKLIELQLLNPAVFGMNTNITNDHHRPSTPSAAPSASSDILKLLHLCRFDECIAEELTASTERVEAEPTSNGHRGGRRQRRSPRVRKSNGDGDHSANDSQRTPSWELLGITAATDPIMRKDRESHIKLIHSDGAKTRSVSARNKLSGGGASGMWSGSGSADAANTNNVTKRCNTRSMLDLKAVYPLQRIRRQNHFRKRSVIVIGAGISGLACARELMQCGYKVTVLEVETLSSNPQMTTIVNVRAHETECAFSIEIHRNALIQSIVKCGHILAQNEWTLTVLTTP